MNATVCDLNELQGGIYRVQGEVYCRMPSTYATKECVDGIACTSARGYHNSFVNTSDRIAALESELIQLRTKMSDLLYAIEKQGVASLDTLFEVEEIKKLL